MNPGGVLTRDDVLTVRGHGVDVNENAGVILLIDAWKTVGCGRLVCGASSDVDLCAFHLGSVSTGDL